MQQYAPALMVGRKIPNVSLESECHFGIGTHNEKGHPLSGRPLPDRRYRQIEVPCQKRMLIDPL